MPSASREGVRLQAARILEDIKTLQRTYGPTIEASDPAIGEALERAADAIQRALGDDGGHER